MYFSDYPIIGAEGSLPLFLISVGLNEWQYHVVCKSGETYAKLMYCTKGSGTLIVGGKSYTIEPYTAFVIPAGVPHEYYTNEDIWDTHWVIPSGYACEDTLRQLGFEKPVVFPLATLSIWSIASGKSTKRFPPTSFSGTSALRGSCTIFL